MDEVTGDTNVPAHDLDELWIAFGSPDGRHMTDEPEKKAGEPKAQTEAECRRQACRSRWQRPAARRPSGSARSRRGARARQIL